MLLLGFVSGTPFLLTLSTLSFWLSENGVSKSVIGLFILATLPYSFKFLWAPLLDHFNFPWLGKKWGRKKTWALVSQLLLIFSIIKLGQCNPQISLTHIAFWAFMVSFFSATQDTVIDALRIEILGREEVGAGAAMETIGFRLGMMLSGAGALYLAQIYSWQEAYTFLALVIILGMVAMFFLAEPTITPLPLQKFSSLVRIYSQSWGSLAKEEQFINILLFIFLFKMGDTVINSMVSPFLCDLGFSKIEFANVSKFFGISLMVVGGLIGGLMVAQLGLFQTTIFCAFLQCISCLLFVIQALVGHNLTVLFITVGIESFTSGLCSAAFIALLSSFCYAPFSASHFTLLYSFGSLCRVIISSGAGILADHLGWIWLFGLTSSVLFPTLCVLVYMKRGKLTSFQPLKKALP